jgi:hypothetical protein
MSERISGKVSERMSTQVLQLNQSKGRVGIQAKKPVAQGADCASAPAGNPRVRYIEVPFEAQTIVKRRVGRQATADVNEAVDNLAKNNLGMAILNYKTERDLRTMQQAAKRRADRLGILIITRSDMVNGELHIFNRAIVG